MGGALSLSEKTPWQDADKLSFSAGDSVRPGNLLGKAAYSHHE